VPVFFFGGGWPPCTCTLRQRVIMLRDITAEYHSPVRCSRILFYAFWIKNAFLRFLNRHVKNVKNA